MKNLADQHPGKVKELAELWQKCESQFRQQAGPLEPQKPRPRGKGKSSGTR